MRKLLALGPVLILAAACSAGAQNGDQPRSGAQGQRTFQVGAFESVSLEGSHDVVVTVGGAPSVRAEGDAEAIERLEISVENGNLRIRSRGGGWFSREHGRVTVHVSAPSLKAASIGGSGDMRIDRAEAPRFDASISGSGDMEIAALTARTAHFSIAGSGDIRAVGRGEEANISIAGSGNAALDSFETLRAHVSIAGSGDVGLRATETVEASIVGSGDVTVRGTTRCSVSKLGSGDVHCAQ